MQKKSSGFITTLVFLKCLYKSFSSPIMNYSEKKSSHSLHYIYNIIMHNNKFFIKPLASVNNFYCLVEISFKQLLISIHSLKLFSVYMCVCVYVYMYECSSLHVCEGVRIHMGALAWRLEIDIRHLPLFFYLILWVFLWWSKSIRPADPRIILPPPSNRIAGTYLLPSSPFNMGIGDQSSPPSGCVASTSPSSL